MTEQESDSVQEEAARQAIDDLLDQLAAQPEKKYEYWTRICELRPAAGDVFLFEDDYRARFAAAYEKAIKRRCEENLFRAVD